MGAWVEKTIQRLAGDAVVLVRQSIVVGDVPDITDVVLAELGLPTDAPTLNRNLQFGNDVAPTYFSQSHVSAVAEAFWKQSKRNRKKEK